MHAETREEIQETLNSKTRVRIPKIYDSSISSQEESDEGSPAVSKGQKRDVDGSRKKLVIEIYVSKFPYRF